MLFGFFPATVAMFSICRRWVLKEYDIPIFKHFLEIYKQEFIKSNKVGFILLVIGLLLYVDIRVLQLSSVFFKPLLIGFYLISLLLILTVLYLFPILSHYEITPLKALKSAALLSISHPIYTITIVAGMFSLYFLFLLIPGLIPLFCGSIPSFVIMWFSYQVFQKNEAKQQITYNNESFSEI